MLGRLELRETVVDEEEGKEFEPSFITQLFVAVGAHRVTLLIIF